MLELPDFKVLRAINRILRQLLCIFVLKVAQKYSNTLKQNILDKIYKFEDIPFISTKYINFKSGGKR